jgi:hypothetical protein
MDLRVLLGNSVVPIPVELPVDENIKHAPRYKMSPEEVLEVLRELPKVFTSDQAAEALNFTRTHTTNLLVSMCGDQLLHRERIGRQFGYRIIEHPLND